MRALLPLLSVLVLLGCSQRVPTPVVSGGETGRMADPQPSNDPIDQLVTALSGTHGLWMNGVASIIQLPETASPEQVLEQVFRMTGFDAGRVTNFQIVRVRSVHIDDDSYTAALVQTNLGKKIVLYTAGGWWSRVYDAQT